MVDVPIVVAVPPSTVANDSGIRNCFWATPWRRAHPRSVGMRRETMSRLDRNAEARATGRTILDNAMAADRVDPSTRPVMESRAPVCSTPEETA